MEYPKLIENGTRTYISDILHKCHQTRSTIYMYALNIGVFVLFVIITTIILYSCYKSKPSVEEMVQKEIDAQKYVLSKIKEYKYERQNMLSRQTITGLPVIDTI